MCSWAGLKLIHMASDSAHALVGGSRFLLILTILTMHGEENAALDDHRLGQVFAVP